MPTRIDDYEFGFSAEPIRPPHHAAWRLPQNWRIAALGFLLMTTLSGCAAFDRAKTWLSPGTKPQAVAEKPAAPTPTPPAPSKERRPWHEAHDAPKPDIQEKIAKIDPNSLIGLEPSAIERILGTPTRTGKIDMSLVWTYASTDCSLQIFFYPDIKTSSFHVLKYGAAGGNGSLIDTSQPCIQRILTVKNNEPG
ncbi:MAG: hypothetical protein KGL56_05045 [Alphaproteobacteria bacterium]|nr:hypothetical protein [Alphaproteobacteria bacterium]MDE2499540.1 hypothetical protein [Alphaproteobacteria bacterium]